MRVPQLSHFRKSSIHSIRTYSLKYAAINLRDILKAILSKAEAAVFLSVTDVSERIFLLQSFAPLRLRSVLACSKERQP